MQCSSRRTDLRNGRQFRVTAKRCSLSAEDHCAHQVRRIVKISSDIETGQTGRSDLPDGRGVFLDQTTGIFIVLICVGCSIGIVVFVVVFRTFQKRKSIESVRDVDKNPVHGSYYFADGTKIDSANSTVQDTNPVYGVSLVC